LKRELMRFGRKLLASGVPKAPSPLPLREMPG
jgi:hypothetical protein